MILLATQVYRNTTGPKGQLQSVSTSTTARVAVEERSLPEGGEKGPRGGGQNDQFCDFNSEQFNKDDFV